MSTILTNLKNKYINMRGFITHRHLLVIESDDWGSIRMPSGEILSELQNQGDHPEKNGFLRNDCLESCDDLDALYDTLTSVYDKKGNPCVITANFAMANPDFENIDYHSGKYAFEPFYETYKRYYPDKDVLGTVKKGIAQRLLCPQLHCREHLNVNRWMDALSKGYDDAVMAFENKMIGVFSSFKQSNPYGYMDAFNTDMSSISELKSITDDAVKIFKSVFGYQSKTFVATCFVWAKEFEKVLAHYGIRGIQSASWQNCPVGKNGKYQLKRKIHFTGEKNKNGQVYTVRNCVYEPSHNNNPKECVNSCFRQICNSFSNHKPAIVNSHRFNYINSINPGNATENLKGLKRLLDMIMKEYPDVEFVTSAELLDIILREEK